MKIKNKPYIICHMMCSVDGKILTKNWAHITVAKNTGKLYETIHNQYDSQAWICGRVTMERDFADGLYTHKGEPANAFEDHIADNKATSFAIAIDASGKLAWKQNNIDGDHLIAVLTEQISQNYLEYLQKAGISYLFAGKKELDLELAVQKVAEYFPVKTLMLEGGGNLNGAMMKAGLIDEVSLLLLPIAEGSASTTVFETGAVTAMKLTHFEKLADDVLWLKYKVG